MKIYSKYTSPLRLFWWKTTKKKVAISLHAHQTPVIFVPPSSSQTLGSVSGLLYNVNTVNVRCPHRGRIGARRSISREVSVALHKWVWVTNSASHSRELVTQITNEMHDSLQHRLLKSQYIYIFCYKSDYSQAQNLFHSTVTCFGSNFMDQIQSIQILNDYDPCFPGFESSTSEAEGQARCGCERTVPRGKVWSLKAEAIVIRSVFLNFLCYLCQWPGGDWWFIAVQKSEISMAEREQGKNSLVQGFLSFKLSKHQTSDTKRNPHRHLIAWYDLCSQAKV